MKKIRTCYMLVKCSLVRSTYSLWMLHTSKHALCYQYLSILKYADVLVINIIIPFGQELGSLELLIRAISVNLILPQRVAHINSSNEAINFRKTSLEYWKLPSVVLTFSGRAFQQAPSLLIINSIGGIILTQI